MTSAPDSHNRWPITISIMLAAVMNTLDSTIANVALPHMQGSVSASSDQISWVLTSYIVAAAIMTPLAGWLAARFGRKQMMLLSIGGFTVASMLCGIATDLPQIVVFRLLQGLFGASLLPMSQAILLDINPPEKHGQAMAIFAMGVIVGPILGPALGGYLTEYFSWRWCFFINLPIGIMAFLGVWVFFSADGESTARRFDFLGFGTITLFIGAIQLMMDRGPGEDWFHSREIWTEAVLAAMGLWVFIIHTLTTEHPFFHPSFARDRNFVTASVFGFFFGVLLYSTAALLPPMMQRLMGYPVLTSGLISIPRGIGSFASMLIVSRLIGRMDTRLILLIGLTLSGISQFQMMQFDLGMTAMPMIVSGMVQGLSVGLIFVPMSTLAFATIAPHLRAEASSLYTLIRNLGSSAGISIMNALVVSNTQTMHASMAARVIGSDTMVHEQLTTAVTSDPAGLMALNGEITRQATMVAYVDDFRLMFFISLCCVPMLLLLRKPRRASAEPIHAAHD